MRDRRRGGHDHPRPSRRPQRHERRHAEGADPLLHRSRRQRRRPRGRGDRRGGARVLAGADIREFVEPLVPVRFREQRRRLDFRQVMDRCPSRSSPPFAATRSAAVSSWPWPATSASPAKTPARPHRGQPGHHPGGGGTQRLPGSWARQGARDDPHRRRLPRRGARIGLVERVVRRRVLPPRAAARTLADKAPVALRYAKEAVVKGLDCPGRRARLEGDLSTLLRTTEDRLEGARAFLEKRRPRWQGQ